MERKVNKAKIFYVQIYFHNQKRELFTFTFFLQQLQLNRTFHNL